MQTPPQRIFELKPVRENPADYDAIEKEIRDVLRKRLYLPIMRLLTGKDVATALANAPARALLSALRQGKITFGRGVFESLPWCHLGPEDSHVPPAGVPVAA